MPVPGTQFGVDAFFSNTIARGLFRGLISESQGGGKFRRGFRSAFIEGVGGYYLQMAELYNEATSIVLRGLSSKAAGGDFVNGAVLAAFSYLFSEALRNPQEENAFGGVTAKSVGKGVTAADLASVEADLKKIAGTKRGSVLFANIKSRGGIDVEVCRGCRKLVCDPIADKIIIDLNISPMIKTTVGVTSATTLRILAHEFGHAGTWTTNKQKGSG